MSVLTVLQLSSWIEAGLTFRGHEIANIGYVFCLRPCPIKNSLDRDEQASNDEHGPGEKHAPTIEGTVRKRNYLTRNVAAKIITRRIPI